MSLRYFIAIGT